MKRTQAVQRGFNQSVVSSGFFTTYHFNDGGYTELAPDTTPPPTPVITDEGVLTANRTQLAASWTSEDSESGIREFSYAIGTTPGGTEVKTVHFNNTEFRRRYRPDPAAGVTYYFAVKAVNGVVSGESDGVSDGIRYDPAYPAADQDHSLGGRER